MNKLRNFSVGILVVSLFLHFISHCKAENNETDKNLKDVDFAFKATEWKRVTTMAVFHDKLYMGVCEEPSVHTSGDIVVYDDATGVAKKIYSVQEQGIQKILVYGDQLVIPGTDSTIDGNIGNIYIFDGNIWTMKSTVGIDRPTAHLWDMAMYNGKMYVATNDRNYTGVLWESGDFGDSWKPVYEYHENLGSLPTYMEGLAVYNGKLYSYLRDDAHGAVDVGLVEFDKNGSRQIEPFGEGIRVSLTSFGNVGEHLYVCGEFGPYYLPTKNRTLVLAVAPNLKRRKSSEKPPVYGCCAFDGTKCAPIPFFNRQSVNAFGSFGDMTVALVYDYKTEQGALVATDDGSEWKAVARLPKGVMGLSLAEYHGRLYIGTMPNGDIYVWKNKE